MNDFFSLFFDENGYLTIFGGFALVMLGVGLWISTLLCLIDYAFQNKEK